MQFEFEGLSKNLGAEPINRGTHPTVGGAYLLCEICQKHRKLVVG